MENPEEVVANWKWQTDKVILLQYLDGITDAFPEDYLVMLYQLAKRDNLLDVLFPEGTSLNAFIRAVSDKPLLVGFVKRYDDSGAVTLDLAGFSWLWQREGKAGCRKATIAYAFLREWWGKKEIRAISRLALRYWYEVAEIDALFGASLRTNRLARRFATELGFHKVADVPQYFSRDGKLVDATFFTLTKDDFLHLEADSEWTQRQHNSQAK